MPIYPLSPTMTRLIATVMADDEGTALFLIYMPIKVTAEILNG